MLLLCLLVFECMGNSITVTGDKVEFETGKFAASISWNSVAGSNFYLIYRKTGEEDWQVISGFNFEKGEVVRVLNAYQGFLQKESARRILR